MPARAPQADADLRLGRSLDACVAGTGRQSLEQACTSSVSCPYAGVLPSCDGGLCPLAAPPAMAVVDASRSPGRSPCSDGGSDCGASAAPEGGLLPSCSQVGADPNSVVYVTGFDRARIVHRRSLERPRSQRHDRLPAERLVRGRALGPRSRRLRALICERRGDVLHAGRGAADVRARSERGISSPTSARRTSSTRRVTSARPPRRRCQPPWERTSGRCRS